MLFLHSAERPYPPTEFPKADTSKTFLNYLRVFASSFSSLMKKSVLEFFILDWQNTVWQSRTRSPASAHFATL